MVQLELSELSEEELRKECVRHGIKPGPITERTRSLWENKLRRLKEANGDSVEVTPESRPEVVHPEPNGTSVDRPITPVVRMITPISTTPQPPVVNPAPSASLYPTLPTLPAEEDEFVEELDEEFEDEEDVPQPVRRRNPQVISPRKAQPCDIYGKRHDKEDHAAVAWVKAIFIAAVLSALVYLFYYHFFTDKTKSV